MRLLTSSSTGGKGVGSLKGSVLDIDIYVSARSEMGALGHVNHRLSRQRGWACPHCSAFSLFRSSVVSVKLQRMSHYRHPYLLAAGIAALTSLATLAADNYPLGGESIERAPGVPKGRIESFVFADSKVFPGTTRDCWLYIPAQYNGSQAAALMVFQDGQAYVREDRDMRVPIVFDNLIAKKEMPVSIGLFVNPGQTGVNPPGTGNSANRSNRSLEYDSLGPDYSKFLIDELLPFVVQKFGLKISFFVLTKFCFHFIKFLTVR